MAKLQLLKTLADWDRYRVALCEQLKIDAANIDFGRGPQTFPCLVTSYPVTPAKVISCIVYPADAVHLLQATDVPMTPMSRQRDPVPSREFEKSVVANILTIVELMVGISICKPAQYESLYTVNLANVDQVHSESKAIHAQTLLDHIRREE